jgi:hypothetical protein
VRLGLSARVGSGPSVLNFGTLVFLGGLDLSYPGPREKVARARLVWFSHYSLNMYSTFMTI